VERSWEDTLMALAAAVAGGALAGATVAQTPFLKVVGAAFLASLATLLIFFLFVFLKNLAAAPALVRKERAVSPARPRDLDAMQMEAELIALKIGWWHENVEPPDDRDDPRVKAMYQMVETFREKAQNDEWLSARNRVRCLDLYEQLKKAADLHEIRALCLWFSTLPPRH
jgi:hypothetical protein